MSNIKGPVLSHPTFCSFRKVLYYKVRCGRSHILGLKLYCTLWRCTTVRNIQHWDWDLNYLVLRIKRFLLCFTTCCSVRLQTWKPATVCFFRALVKISGMQTLMLLCVHCFIRWCINSNRDKLTLCVGGLFFKAGQKEHVFPNQTQPKTGRSISHWVWVKFI